jgi:hypothetical protein
MGAKGAWHPRNFGNFTTQRYILPLNFEDLVLIGTRCFKFPIQALPLAPVLTLAVKDSRQTYHETLFEQFYIDF